MNVKGHLVDDGSKVRVMQSDVEAYELPRHLRVDSEEVAETFGDVGRERIGVQFSVAPDGQTAVDLEKREAFAGFSSGDETANSPAN